MRFRRIAQSRTPLVLSIAATISAALVGLVTPSVAAVPATPPTASQKTQLQRNGFAYLYSIKIAGGVAHYAFRRDGTSNGITTISLRGLAVMRSRVDANLLVATFVIPAKAKAACNLLGSTVAKQSGFRLVSCRVLSATQSGRNATIQLAIRMRPL